MSSNQEQIEYWNERAGETWAELQDRPDALLAPLSAAGLAAALCCQPAQASCSPFRPGSIVFRAKSKGCSIATVH